jgi:hypothetical protein
VNGLDYWRGSTRQVCGLWPFAVGAGTPMAGVPLGRHLRTGATLCGDPISWFQRAHLISNPSIFVLGLPGLGKSSLVRRMLLGLTGYGVQPLVLGDLKAEYVPLIRALGGQVIELGRGRGRLNVLDPGTAPAAASRLTGDARRRLLEDAHGRRHTMTATLVTLLRQSPPSDHEETLLDRAITLLDERHPGVPVLEDLIRILNEAPAELRDVALDRGHLPEYRTVTDPLIRTLSAMLGRGQLGELFGGQTTVAMQRDRPVVFDVSSLDGSDATLQAAVLMAIWSHGFAAVTVANELADAGLERRNRYYVVLDELWRTLRGGRGMVDRVDALTRLNRQWGVGTAMLSHTMSDLQALPTEEDRAKAAGFVERSGMVALAGLPRAEMSLLAGATRLTEAEQLELEGWVDPPAWDQEAGVNAAPPGRGRFLIKVGGRPGIPIKVALTSVERDLYDTNRRWR